MAFEEESILANMNPCTQVWFDQLHRCVLPDEAEEEVNHQEDWQDAIEKLTGQTGIHRIGGKTQSHRDKHQIQQGKT